MQKENDVQLMITQAFNMRKQKSQANEVHGSLTLPDINALLLLKHWMRKRYGTVFRFLETSYNNDIFCVISR